MRLIFEHSKLSLKKICHFFFLRLILKCGLHWRAAYNRESTVNETISCESINCQKRRQFQSCVLRSKYRDKWESKKCIQCSRILCKYQIFKPNTFWPLFLSMHFISWRREKTDDDGPFQPAWHLWKKCIYKNTLCNLYHISSFLTTFTTAADTVHAGQYCCLAVGLQ